MAATRARIAAIIVNYGTADLALEAVRSLLEQTNAEDLDVHVVENASPGEDAATLANGLAVWPSVTLHIQPENCGFGHANNHVIKLLARNPPDYVFLLNPDARVENDVTAHLAEFLEACPRAGFAGAALRQAGSMELRAAAFRFPTFLIHTLQAIGSHKLSRRFPKARIVLDTGSAPMRADWVTGAALMIRWEALQTLGGFDEAFFLYWEDVDLMRRGAALGYGAWHVPRAVVIHQGGASTGVPSDAKRHRMPRYWFDAWRTYHLKHHGRLWVIAAALIWIVTSGLSSTPKRAKDVFTHILLPQRGKSR